MAKRRKKRFRTALLKGVSQKKRVATFKEVQTCVAGEVDESGSEFFSAFLGKFAFTKPELLSFLLRVAPGFCVGPRARHRARGPPTRRRSGEEGQGPYARGAGGPSAGVRAGEQMVA